MRCSRCGSDVREGLRFCTGCGAPLGEVEPGPGAQAEVSGGAPIPGGRPTWGRIVALVCAVAAIVLVAAVAITSTLAAGSVRVALDTIEELRSRVEDEGGSSGDGTERQSLDVTWREVTQTVSIPNYDMGMQEKTMMEGTWGFLELSADERSEVIDRLNEGFREAFESELSRSANWSFDEGANDGECTAYRSSLTYARDGVIGIRVETYGTLWGPHGWSEVKGSIFDLTTGEELNAWDVVGMSEDELDARAVDAVTTYASAHSSNLVLPKGEDEIRSMAQDLVENDEYAGYQLTEDGITIFLPSYSMGFPYSDGTKEVLVVSFGDSSLVGTDVRGSVRLL